MDIDPRDIFASAPSTETPSQTRELPSPADDSIIGDPTGMGMAEQGPCLGGSPPRDDVSIQERRRPLEAEALPLMDLVYSVARRLVGNDARAEDLVQETYLRAFRAAGQYRLGTNCKAWLLTILRSAFLDFGRQIQARGGTHEQLPANALAPAERTDLPIDSERFMSILDRMVDDDVRDAMLQLPDVYREAFVMVVIAELTYKEAALVLGVQEGTLKSRVYRACQMLKSKLWSYAIDRRLAKEADERPVGKTTAKGQRGE